MCRREVEVLGAVLGGAGTPVERIAAGVQVFARRALENRGLAYALLAAPAEPSVGGERLEFRRRYRELFAEVTAEGMAQGVLPPQNADVTAAALTGAVGEVLVAPLGAPEGGDTTELLSDLTAMALLCAALRGSPTRSSTTTVRPSTGGPPCPRPTSRTAAPRGPRTR